MKRFTYLLLLVMSACELVVDVDQPPFEPSIVMGSFIGPDTTILVNLSEDRYVLERPYEFTPITGATVRLFEGDRLIGVVEELDLTEDDPVFPNQFRGFYGLDYRPTPGISYRIEVEKEGFTTVQATDQVPAIAPRFDILEVDLDDFSEAEIELKIYDEVGRDYYEVLAYLSKNEVIAIYDEETQTWAVDSTWRSKELLWLYTENIAVEEHNTSIFSDRLFDGRSYDLDLETYIGVYTNPEIDVDPEPVLTVEVRRVSEAYYNYVNSAALQSWVDGDPFAEPVQAFSNVENGRGVLGSYISTKQEFAIEIEE